MTYLSALARKGFSGGAVGSSQSPSWKPVSHNPLPEVRAAQVRTCSAMVEWNCSRIARLPYVSHSAHGTHTAASPQIEVGVSDGQPGLVCSSLITLGTISGTTP